ncbi:hypothetical protein GRX03_07390 [Halovenus sp. WSH3]|uniref:Uncharacterized protein n=1 Tax=Halovenus carboxidivorans TaxID=2692199 RepID=A0A6B0T0N6_9EURY|nr:hypothetical protein [Halovenus carboxidivorans]MXR51425.1 hypothetical protein [Halovenus carboxidivorans]
MAHSRRQLVLLALFALGLVLVGAPTDGAAASNNVTDPTLVYVQESSGNLTIVDSEGTKVYTGVSHDTSNSHYIKSIGPSVDYDGDGTLEVPYTKQDGTNGPHCGSSTSKPGT